MELTINNFSKVFIKFISIYCRTRIVTKQSWTCPKFAGSKYFSKRFFAVLANYSKFFSFSSLGIFKRYGTTNRAKFVNPTRMQWSFSLFFAPQAIKFFKLRYFIMAMNCVFSSIFKQFKVFYSVIKAISIYVMNNFGRSKFSFNVLFHNMTMFCNGFFVNANIFIFHLLSIPQFNTGCKGRSKTLIAKAGITF